MCKTALFVRHTAKPGKRSEVQEIWERYVRDYVAANSQQPAYFYCFDDKDPDVIVVFQLYADQTSGRDFTQQPWYPEYERETAALLAGPSEFRSATPKWMKGLASE
ncbi:putative quinol monooxygenase [Neorhizobium tomejilense]|uniref:putative quinol monooxygenase n=1 Tax=Neorhizobium tomejilense TaxID=2093828 RepID=UPI003ECD5707